VSPAAMAVYNAVLGGTIAGSEKVSGTAGSRLTKEVLVGGNGNVSSCAAFNNTYTDSGLFGVYGSFKPAHSKEYVASLGKALQGAAKGVSAEELNRAKNIAKNAILRGTDRAMDLCEDIGRQMVMGGNALHPIESAAAIDGVTDAQVKAAAQLFAKCKPTVVACGSVGHLPSYDEITAALQGK